MGGYKPAALRRWDATGDSRLDAQGGYLLRVESLRELDVAGLARSVLALEGLEADGVSLQLGIHPRRKVARLAFRGARQFEGLAGARWHATHHLMASQLSLRTGAAVQAYAVLPGELEKVVTYGNGRQVGGETLSYDDVELTDEQASADAAYALLQRSWPLGHLAHVFGLGREELLSLAGRPGLLLSLDGRETIDLDALLPETAPSLRMG